MKLSRWFSASLALVFGSIFSLSTHAADNFQMGSYDPGQQSAQTATSSPSSSSSSQFQPYASQLFHADDPTAGNPRGGVTLVEFFDYRCGHCQRMASVVASLIRRNPNLRVVFKEFPIFGDTSIYASKAALAARNQGKYFVFHEALMNSSQSLTADVIMDIAKRVGLDINKLAQDMKNSNLDYVIKSNDQLATRMGINATPVFLVGKTNGGKNSGITAVYGEVDSDRIQQVINDMR